jgi:hypothetical protein
LTKDEVDDRRPPHSLQEKKKKRGPHAGLYFVDRVLGLEYQAHIALPHLFFFNYYFYMYFSK